MTKKPESDYEIKITDEEYAYWECAMRGDEGGDDPSAIARGKIIRDKYTEEARAIAKGLHQRVVVTHPDGFEVLVVEKPKRKTVRYSER